MPQGNPILLPLLLCLLAFYVAWRRGFFILTPRGQDRELSASSLLVVFLIYFGVVFIIPLLIVLIMGALHGNLKEALVLARSYSSITLIVIQLLAISFVFLSLVLFLFRNRSLARLILFGDGEPNVMRNIKLGALTWLLAYPFVLLTNGFFGQIAEYIFGKHELEQAALMQLKALLKTPLLFTFAAALVVIIIPFIEELCFRGFLQRYLRQKMGSSYAILVTSVLFSLLHYSKSQGIGNIELIPSLFVLSIFLGFLYERQNNLFASFGLHAVFNGITVSALFFVK